MRGDICHCHYCVNESMLPTDHCANKVSIPVVLMNVLGIGLQQARPNSRPSDIDVGLRAEMFWNGSV